eukprot:COSAG01_NODE_508_length_16107_cov_120.001187_21_plen_165_part_00
MVPVGAFVAVEAVRSPTAGIATGVVAAGAALSYCLLSRVHRHRPTPPQQQQRQTAVAAARRAGPRSADAELAELTSFAEELADATEAVVLRYFRSEALRGAEADLKKDLSAKTAAEAAAHGQDVERAERVASYPDIVTEARDGCLAAANCCLLCRMRALRCLAA